MYRYQAPATPFDAHYGSQLVPSYVLQSPAFPTPQSAFSSQLQSPWLYTAVPPAGSMSHAKKGKKKKFIDIDSTIEVTFLEAGSSGRLLLFSNMDKSVTVPEFLDFVKFGPVEGIWECEQDDQHIQFVLAFNSCAVAHSFHLSVLQTLGECSSLLRSPQLKIQLVTCGPEIKRSASGETRCCVLPRDLPVESSEGVPQDVVSALERIKTYGAVERVDVHPHHLKVHFTNIQSAVHCLAEEAGYFGPDRCCSVNVRSINQQPNESRLDSIKLNVSSRECVPQIVHVDFDPVIQTRRSIDQRSNSIGSLGTGRTIYLSNINSITKVSDLCNVIRGGALQNIAYHAAKQEGQTGYSFVTFLNPGSANNFLTNVALEPLVLHGKKLRIGWASQPDPPLARSVSLAVSVGGCRVVYVSLPNWAFEEKFRAERDAKPVPVLPSEAEIIADFQPFGQIEQVNFHKDGHCCWVNFHNISSAIKLVDDANGVSKPDFLNYYAGRYNDMVIGYGRDRCGGPFKSRRERERRKKKEEAKPVVTNALGISSAQFNKSESYHPQRPHSQADEGVHMSFPLVDYSPSVIPVARGKRESVSGSQVMAEYLIRKGQH